MARYKGLASFSANFEPQIAAPLDARAVVDVFNDLLETITWTANDGLIYAYRGMVVSVINDLIEDNNGLYMLVDDDYTKPESWELVNKRGGGEAPSGETIYTNIAPTPIEVGGIKVGESFSGETMGGVFDRLFYPTLYPEIVEPFVTFEFVNPDDMYQEMGDTGVTFTVRTTVNLGTINPPYGTSGLRTPGIDRVYFTGFSRGKVYDSGIDDYVDFNGTVTTNNLVTERTVSYLTSPLSPSTNISSNARVLLGEQPIDSKGNAYLLPYPGSILPSKTIVLYAVYPYFATTASIGTLTKQKLGPHTAEYWEVNMIGETDDDKQTVEFPTAFGAITGIMFLNTISNTWEWINGSKANSINSFHSEVVVKTIHGVNVNYNRFTHVGSKVGARRLRYVK